ncbi:hypothetical protein ACXEIE_001145 [Klebsiella pneumoniae]|uniref:hypothetical protein n=2 Tax=Klebsiella/Raoultella group TaxID=2890311 RepID=UPI0010D2A307|nr:hypothetical protein [Klebsiella pneumoniae]MCE0022583.1 hypothetical protein [Klebsiella pneumoniae]MEC4471171.1 hypothetical protein [Klebsiella pneumoniae]VGA39180.1 Uncharacterised protein [Klebsiella pneumoniae]
MTPNQFYNMNLRKTYSEVLFFSCIAFSRYLQLTSMYVMLLLTEVGSVRAGEANFLLSYFCDYEVRKVMNLVDRALIRSVAYNQVKLEKEKGRVYSPESVIDIWNTDYNLVNHNDLPALQKQYALEVAAERASVGVSIPINKTGVVEIKFDALRGQLSLGPKAPSGSPGNAGSAIEA